MVIDPTPVYHRASIGDHGWGQGLWTSPTGPSAYDDAPSVSFLGSSLAAGTPPVGEGSNGAYFDCSLGRAGDGGGGGGAGAGGGGGGTSAGWVMGAHNPQPQAGAGGGGGGGSGGGGSRGRPGRKPHPRPEDLQSHVDALSAQFGRLSSENQFLKSKLKALETVLPWRETSLNFLASLKAGGSSSSNGSSSGGPAVAAAAAAAAAHASSHRHTAATAEQGRSGYCMGSGVGSSRPGAAAAGAHATATAAAPVFHASVAAAAAGGPPQYGVSAGQEGSAGAGLAGAGAGLGGAGAGAGGADQGGGGSLRGSPAGWDNSAAEAAVAAAAAGRAGVHVTTSVAAGSHHPQHHQQHQQHHQQYQQQQHQQYQHQPQQPQQSQHQHPHQHQPQQVPLIVALCPGLEDGEVPDIPPAAIEELKRVGVAEFCLLWKHIAMQSSLLGAGAEAAGPGSAKAARLSRYMERMTEYLDKVIRLSPLCWLQSMHVNVETGLRERPSDDYWLAVGRYANLSRPQLQEVAHLAQLLDQAVEPVVQERARLASQLSSHIRNTPARPTALDATAALTAVDELAELLQRNMQLELRTHDNVTDFLWLSTLSPVQGARVVAAAYPFVPDALAILHACRQLLGS
ncbi:hypothetical protein CHLRE_05g240350v5 [Chlamydomonas reinhardtii]|uniref:Uncharacterized protein n=1 Tax=Chlamydomonas reinhardtii TaxID=3055 RepID=A0A2K3DT72_CHLRE|nr:uncharacterized protein CHLRE_05g240350v5 [Chlamydomonas reinhardtii]PNW83717.1 hypothetical protein CHLRE_05g240350v5 [Chlamydomonas reinhardtii]